MQGFVKFVREQGVVGFAIGFILGVAAKDVVSSLVDDVISPIIGIFLGPADNLTEFVIFVGPAEVRIGSFLMVLLDFLIVSAVVYFVFKGLKLEKLDREKPDKK